MSIIRFPTRPRRPAAKVGCRVNYLVAEIESRLSFGTFGFFRAVVDEADPYFRRVGGRSDGAKEASDKARLLSKLFEELGFLLGGLT